MILLKKKGLHRTARSQRAGRQRGPFEVTGCASLSQIFSWRKLSRREKKAEEKIETLFPVSIGVFLIKQVNEHAYIPEFNSAMSFLFSTAVLRSTAFYFLGV
jgi:hypothetical protein